MRTTLVCSLIVSLLFAPCDARAQRGGGGGGGGGGNGGSRGGGGSSRGGGGGFGGGQSGNRGGGGSQGRSGGGMQNADGRGGPSAGSRGTAGQGGRGGGQSQARSGPGPGAGHAQSQGGGNRGSGGGAGGSRNNSNHSSGNRTAHNSRPGPSHQGQHHSFQSHGGHGGHQHSGGHDHFHNRPSYHAHWHHGDWHGHWGRPWGYYPVGWYWGGGPGWGWGFAAGVATVGISVGSPWGWGYYSYWNPYWVAPPGGVTYINYSQPIVVMEPAAASAPAVVGGAPVAAAGAPAPTLAQAPTPATVPASSSSAAENSSREKALEIFENARGLFKRDDYPLALAEINRAVALVPNDSLMHEFCALCLFAKRDYQQSAAALYAVLSAGPGWDSATVVGLYSTPGAYTDHLLALEAYRNEHPQAADARFVLAYHFLLAGQNEQAETELAAVVELEPKDQLSAQLLSGLRAKPPAELPAGAPAPELPASAAAPVENAPPVAAADLLGNWKASRADGSKFELSLGDDSKFHWHFTQQEKDQEFSGTYTLANNMLILSASGQNALVGQVSLEANDKLLFKLAGGSPADPGLTFTR